MPLRLLRIHMNAADNPPDASPAAVVLEEYCASADQVPTAFLALVTDESDLVGKIMLYHILSKLQNIVGLPIAPVLGMDNILPTLEMWRMDNTLPSSQSQIQCLTSYPACSKFLRMSY